MQNVLQLLWMLRFINDIDYSSLLYTKLTITDNDTKLQCSYLLTA